MTRPPIARGGAIGACARYWRYNARPVLQRKTGTAVWAGPLGRFVV
ncbi:MAG TPA: hypothetical protein VNR18_01465 [Hyphomicrobiales bacterium]|nr:hypothetical protein [Hyphomicrobiales bacterium]